MITAQIGGSRACGVTRTATFGDGIAVAVVAWDDCVRAFESGGLPACIQHRPGALVPRHKRWARARAGQRTAGVNGPDAYLAARHRITSYANSIKLSHPPPLTRASGSETAA
jgi:hypothetical protein